MGEGTWRADRERWPMVRLLDALDAADALAQSLDGFPLGIESHRALAAYRAIVAPASAERSGAAPEGAPTPGPRDGAR